MWMLLLPVPPWCVSWLASLLLPPCSLSYHHHQVCSLKSVSPPSTAVLMDTHVARPVLESDSKWSITWAGIAFNTWLDILTQLGQNSTSARFILKSAHWYNHIRKAVGKRKIHKTGSLFWNSLCSQSNLGRSWKPSQPFCSFNKMDCPVTKIRHRQWTVHWANTERVFWLIPFYSGRTSFLFKVAG